MIRVYGFRAGCLCRSSKRILKIYCRSCRCSTYATHAPANLVDLEPTPSSTRALKPLVDLEPAQSSIRVQRALKPLVNLELAQSSTRTNLVEPTTAEDISTWPPLKERTAKRRESVSSHMKGRAQRAQQLIDLEPQLDDLGKEPLQEFQEMGTESDEAYVCAMNAAVSAKELDHWWARGFPRTPTVLSVLMRAYARFGATKKASECLVLLQEQGAADQRAYRSMFIAMKRCRTAPFVEDIDKVMEEIGPHPWDVSTYCCAAHVYARKGAVHAVERIVLEMETHAVPLNDFIYVAWFRAAMRSKQFSTSQRAFRHLKESEITMTAPLLVALEEAFGRNRARAMTKDVPDVDWSEIRRAPSPPHYTG